MCFADVIVSSLRIQLILPTSFTTPHPTKTAHAWTAEARISGVESEENVCVRAAANTTPCDFSTWPKSDAVTKWKLEVQHHWHRLYINVYSTLRGNQTCLRSLIDLKIDSLWLSMTVCHLDFHWDDYSHLLFPNVKHPTSLILTSNLLS